MTLGTCCFPGAEDVMERCPVFNSSARVEPLSLPGTVPRHGDPRLHGQDLHGKRQETRFSPPSHVCLQDPHGGKEKPIGPTALASLSQPGRSVSDPGSIPASADPADLWDRVYSRQDGVVIPRCVAA